jgi:apolipoprotein N-acyltransferase
MINKYLSISALSLLYVLSFAPYLIFPFGIISIAGLSYFFSKLQTKKELISCSLLVSLVISIFGMYWIIYASEYSFGSIFLGIFVLIGFSLLYSVFIFFVSIPIYLTKNRGIFYYFVLVISWSTMDALKFYFLGGFPWFVSAYMWSFSLEIIQIVSLIGIMGLSIFSYALIFSFLFLFNKKVSIYLRINLFVLFFAIFMGFYSYGAIRLFDLKGLSVQKEVSIRLVQTNIAQKNKMSLEDLKFYSQEIIAQSLENIYDKNLEIIFLPEVSFLFLSEDDINEIVKQIPSSTYLVTGALRFDKYNKIYNSIFSLNKDGYHNHYDKIKLVPFGEKTPFSEYFPILLNFVGLSNFSAGNEIKILNINNIYFALTICFEGLFPSEGLNANNIDFILNSANEGWFNKSIELKQNWDIYKFRSIELGVPSIKVANTGISGVYDLTGTLIIEVEQFKKLNQDVLLPIRKRETYYSKINYHIINYLLFILYCFSCFYLIFKAKSKNKPST